MAYAAAVPTPGLAALRGRPLGFLCHYVRRHPLGHAIVVASVFCAVACAVSTQYGMKHLIDIVSAGQAAAGSRVWGAFALLCGLVATDNLMWRVGGYAAHRTFVSVTGDVRRDLFAHLSGHSPGYFAERLPGALASRISATANAAFTLENTGVWNVIPPSLGVLFSIALIGSVNLMLAAVLMGIAGGLGAMIFWLARRGIGLHRAYAESAAAVDGELVDVIGNFGVVRAFGATFREQARIGATMKREMGDRRRSLYYLENLRLIHAVLTALLTAGVVAWGIILWQRGQASVGDLVLMTALAFNILHGSRDLAVALVDLTQHVARLHEALGSLLIPHELPDRADASLMPVGRGEVVFDHVKFAYPGRAAVLRDFDLEIESGQRVGLVGYSGAGKSTVLALLQRFYDVAGGCIMVDGQDIRAVTQESLRQSMAIVPQDISLFHRSVLENIRYARPDATEREVLAAAEMAHCRDFIEALPEGFATMVGDRGVKLSGGQRQRLAIARALLKDAPILLLDEATSALDTESEQAIQAALDRLMAGRTVIAIAHRLSTLQNFDRIIVMDKGRIVDDGSPAALASRPGPIGICCASNGWRRWSRWRRWRRRPAAPPVRAGSLPGNEPPATVWPGGRSGGPPSGNSRCRITRHAAAAGPRRSAWPGTLVNIAFGANRASAAAFRPKRHTVRVMKSSLLWFGAAALATSLTTAAMSQPVPPLTFVQPVPPSAVQAVQQQLRQAGAYTGSVDGVWGPDSVTALERFQSSHELQANGQLNQATLAALNLDPGMLLGTQQATVGSPQTLTPASVRTIQARLRTLGFYNGDVDGVWGQSTAGAIQQFQQNRGLQPTGALNQGTVTAMGLTPDALAYR